MNRALQRPGPGQVAVLKLPPVLVQQAVAQRYLPVQTVRA